MTMERYVFGITTIFLILYVRLRIIKADTRNILQCGCVAPIHIHPFPTWSDYIVERAENTWDVQRSILLSAIFFIEQSEVDNATPLSVSQASILISNSAVQAIKGNKTLENRKYHSSIMTTIFNNSLDIAKLIPAFRLKVSLKGEFWKEIERVVG